MLALSSSVFALCAAPVTSVAQEGAEEIEEIVVSGLRGRPRSAVDSAVPIDTFDLTAIEQVSHTDTQDILQTLIPSLNVDRAPISDGSTFIRNTQLRGLPAHHTLVLVNGKRRHRASLVQTGGSGRQGPDVATIPAAALQSIEVLRDGASSQYGSDAIAGVINFNLRNFMIEGGKPLENLHRILEHYPVVQHGVSLCIGSSDPLDFDYLKKLKALTKITKTPWVSDHLSWGRLEGAHYHDLLPLPYTQEVIDHVAERARIVQDYLELPFALENLSSYAAFKDDQMPEWEFYSAVVEKADIHMMLDVNNIYVSSVNHGFDPKDYYLNIPMERVLQIHLAGHRNMGDYIIDTHDDYVCDEVWKIYADVYPLTGGVSTLLEFLLNKCPDESCIPRITRFLVHVGPRSHSELAY